MMMVLKTAACVMYHHAVWHKFNDISEEFATSVLRGEEDEDSRFI
jgi:hypothetical protein